MAYSLDKSISKAQSFKDADNQFAYWSRKTPQERLKASWFLTCQAFRLEYSTRHKLDRLIHSTRKHLYS